MKIVITGGTGLIGQTLVKKLLEKKHNIFVVGRSKEKITSIYKNSVTPVNWYINDPYSEKNNHLSEILSNCDAVIHLAGQNIAARRWNKSFKEQIVNSRIDSTALLTKIISSNDQRPRIFISASAIGYYGTIIKSEVTESTPPGNDFMAELCLKWEKASEPLNDLGVRRVIVRTGIVLSIKEGALKKLLLPFKLFVGGPIGTGKQWFPWIHINDLASIFIFALENDIEGPLNGVAPESVTMNEFCKRLGHALNRPSFFKVPSFILRIILGEAANYFVEGVNIKPARLARDFRFEFGSVEKALKNLL